MWSVPPAEPPAQETEPGIGDQIVDQILHRLVLGIGRHDNHLIFGRQARERGDVVERHRGLVGRDRADHDHAHHHQRVRVAGVVVHQLREPDRAARAFDIEDLDGVVDDPALQHLLDLTRGRVPSAARRGRRHDLERFARIVAGLLRERDPTPRSRGERKRHQAQQNDDQHARRKS